MASTSHSSPVETAVTEIFGILNQPLLAMDALLTPERCEMGLMILGLIIVFISSIPWNRNDDLVSVGSAGVLVGALGGAYALWMFFTRTNVSATDMTAIAMAYVIVAFMASALGAWVAMMIKRRQRPHPP